MRLHMSGIHLHASQSLESRPVFRIMITEGGRRKLLIPKLQKSLQRILKYFLANKVTKTTLHLQIFNGY